MAQLLGGLFTSHVPAIGGAIAKGLQQDPYWRPFFDGFNPVHRGRPFDQGNVVTIGFEPGSIKFGENGRPTAESWAMIKRRIADNLETDALTADELCRHFQISRATLYRLFEADGGLSHYVREQRLNLAFRQLISPSAEDTRLIDLAVGMRFSSDSTFIRAFRRKFGLTPGELRELADNWLRETGAVPTIDTVLHQLARRRTS